MKRIVHTTLLALAGAVPLAQAADLSIRIDKVGSSEGQLMVALYDAGGFLKQPLRNASVAASAGATSLVIKDLAPGDYGIAVYHDVNGNGKMDRNLMGIPVEPFAFGRNAQGVMGPPGFDAVKLALPAAGLATSITLR